MGFVRYTPDPHGRMNRDIMGRWCFCDEVDRWANDTHHRMSVKIQELQDELEALHYDLEQQEIQGDES